MTSRVREGELDIYIHILLHSSQFKEKFNLVIYRDTILSHNWFLHELWITWSKLFGVGGMTLIGSTLVSDVKQAKSSGTICIPLPIKFTANMLVKYKTWLKLMLGTECELKHTHFLPKYWCTFSVS